jgi:hypothetical protein
MSKESKQYGLLRIVRETGECYLCHESFSSKKGADQTASQLMQDYGDENLYTPVQLATGWTYESNYT